MATGIQPAVLLCLLLAVNVSFGSLYAPVTFQGGDGGSSSTQKLYTDGRTLKKLEVWAGKWQLRGIKFHWSNGHVDTIGKEKGKKEFKFTFNTGERLKSLSIWSSKGKHGKRCGAFKMITTSDREFFPKMTKKVKKKNRAEVDIGSGIIIGFQAYHGNDVDALGFRILRSIKSAILKNVRYPDINLNSIGLQPWDLESVDYKNNASVAQTFTLKGKRQVTTSSSWSTSSSLELSITTTVEAGIPEVASVTTETTWKVGVTSSHEREQTHKFTKVYESPVTVGPRKHLMVTGTVYDGPINTKYSGTMHVILDNGQSFTYDVSGYYNGVSSTRVYKTVKETSI